MGTADRIYRSVGKSVAASRPGALLKALRPQQWIKNGLVFLPFMFAIRQAWSLDDLGPGSRLDRSFVGGVCCFLCTVGGCISF